MSQKNCGWRLKLFRYLGSSHLLLSLLVLGCLAPSSLLAGSLELPNFRSEYQDGEFSCWAAVTKMVLESSYQRKHKECTVITLVRGGECCGFLGGLESRCDRRGDVAAALKSFGYKTIEVVPSLAAIIKTLKNGRLPILKIDYLTTPQTSHVVVAYKVRNIEAGELAIVEIFDPNKGYFDLRYSDLRRSYFGFPWTKLILPQ